MKNYIDDLSKIVEVRKAEALELQNKIDFLESQKKEAEDRKQKAFLSKNQSDYLSIHQEIKEIDGEIEAFKSYLKDTQKDALDKNEVITAWNKTLDSFEKDRRAKVKEYLRMKGTLAKMCREFWSEEKKMRELYEYARSMGKIESFSGELAEVHSVENDPKTSCSFFRKEFDSIGFSFADYISGNY